MTKILWNSLLFGSALLSAALYSGEKAAATEALANTDSSQVTTSTLSLPSLLAQTPGPVSAPEMNSSMDQLIQYGREGRSRQGSGQVTSVSQLRDVQPTDWAFQALQSLVERYGCIAGYPDGTYKGNRPMTRYEFAAGLNACLDRINELIAQATANAVTREDLATLQRLQEEFRAEVATLRGRVDALEARTAELEANQFSTTTKLTGEAIFAVTDSLGGDRIHFDRLAPELNARYGYNNDEDNTVFQSRVRLNFNTSFTGKDLLITRLQAGNGRYFGFQPGVGTQTYFVGNEAVEDNIFKLDTLQYIFNVSENIAVHLSANRGRWDDFVPTLNPYLEDFDGGNGSLSTFGQRNSLYRIGGGQGIGVNVNLGRTSFLGLGGINIAGGYLADQGNNPADGAGLFNGDYAAMGQITFTPTTNFSFGFNYVHGYHTQGNDIFDQGSGISQVGTPWVSLPTALNSAVTNSYGAQASLRFSPKFLVTGWFGYTDVRVIGRTDGEMWNYALNLVFPDLGRRGNVLGIVAGAPPYLGGLDNRRVPNDTPLHVEAFYKFRVSDNISITPGVMWITRPLQHDGDDDIFIGTVRTTFNF